MKFITFVSALLISLALIAPAHAQQTLTFDDLISDEAQETADLSVQDPMVSTVEVELYGQPDLAQLDQWASDGVRTVINALTPRETAAMDFNLAEEVEARGMTYVHIPVSGSASGVETTQALSDALAYVEGPVALHCRSGHRAAHLYAASLIREGAISRDAYQSVDPGRAFDEDLLSRLLGEDR